MSKKKSEGAGGRPGARNEAGKVERVVTASFTIPAEEYKSVNDLGERMLNRRKVVTRSELVRAGLVLLRKLSDKEVAELIESLPKVRPGRPSK